MVKDPNYAGGRDDPAAALSQAVGAAARMPAPHEVIGASPEQGGHLSDKVATIMKKSHEIAIKQSEAREKLAGLMGKDTRTDAEDVELRELQGTMKGSRRSSGKPSRRMTPPRPRPSSPPARSPDAEERERRELAARVGTAPFIAAASQGLAVSGAARELSDAYGAAGHMPLTLLGAIGRPDQPRRELRAVTPGVTEDGTDPTAPYIFQRTVTEQLVPGAIRMVPSGSYHSVTLTTAPTAELLDKSADAAGQARARSHWQRGARCVWPVKRSSRSKTPRSWPTWNRGCRRR